MNKNAVIIAAIIIVAVHALILFLALHPGGTPEKMDADTDTVAADAEPAEAKAEAAKPEPDGRNAQPDAPAVPAPA